jgi:hypothetical protein
MNEDVRRLLSGLETVRDVNAVYLVADLEVGARLGVSGE